MLGFGLLIGSVAADVGSMLGSESTKKMLADLGGRGTLSEIFLGAEFAVIAAIVAGYAVAAVLRLSSEEAAGHAELVLATRVSRARWYAGHVLIALLGSAWLMLFLGLATGVGLGARAGGTAGAIGHELQAAAVQIPAVWVVAGAAAALVGLARRFAAGGWVVLAVSAVVGLVRHPARTSVLGPEGLAVHPCGAPARGHVPGDADGRDDGGRTSAQLARSRPSPPS